MGQCNSKKTSIQKKSASRATTNQSTDPFELLSLLANFSNNKRKLALVKQYLLSHPNVVKHPSNNPPHLDFLETTLLCSTPNNTEKLEILQLLIDAGAKTPLPLLDELRPFLPLRTYPQGLYSPNLFESAILLNCPLPFKIRLIRLLISATPTSERNLDQLLELAVLTPPHRPFWHLADNGGTAQSRAPIATEKVALLKLFAELGANINANSNLLPLAIDTSNQNPRVDALDDKGRLLILNTLYDLGLDPKLHYGYYSGINQTALDVAFNCSSSPFALTAIRTLLARGVDPAQSDIISTIFRRDNRALSPELTLIIIRELIDAGAQCTPEHLHMINHHKMSGSPHQLRSILSTLQTLFKQTIKQRHNAQRRLPLVRIRAMRQKHGIFQPLQKASHSNENDAPETKGHCVPG